MVTEIVGERPCWLSAFDGALAGLSTNAVRITAQNHRDLVQRSASL